MTTKTTDKNSLKILCELLKKYSNKEEIIEKCNIKSGAFFKHLTELKQADFKIMKDGSNYKIKAFSNLIELKNTDTSTIAHLLVLAHFILSKKKAKNLKTAIEKILLLSSKEKYDEIHNKFELFKKAKIYSDYSDKISEFEELINKNKITKITTQSNQSYILKPINIIMDEKNIYFHFYDEEKNENKTILFEDITKIIPIDESENDIEFKNETIFELYGRLAKNYRLKKNERLIEKFPNKIVIANSNSDKKVLFKRLLRYDVLCKIIHSKNDVKEFQNLVNNSLRKLKSGV